MIPHRSVLLRLKSGNHGELFVINRPSCLWPVRVRTVDAAWSVSDDVIVAFCSVTDPQQTPSRLPQQIAHLRFNELSMEAAAGGTAEGRYCRRLNNVVLRGRWSLIGPDRPVRS